MTSIYEVHDHFPAFLSKIEGEEIILEREGKPIAKIIPLRKKRKRILAKKKGKYG